MLAVVFDLDGCLVDSRLAFATCVNDALAEHGLERRRDEELHSRIGPPLHSTFELFAPPDLVQACVDSYRAGYKAQSATLTNAFDGISGLLARLSADLPLVVATSKPLVLAEPLLIDLGLRDFFQAVFGPTPEAEHETKFQTLGRALESVEDLPAVMIGDRSFDMEAAVQHDVAGIGVTWGIGSVEELRAAGATVTVDTPAELEAEVRQRSAAGQAMR
jgi:phosphoglycolate phosphatase